jgi:predicted DNA-binding ribbon-helix-helix protein
MPLKKRSISIAGHATSITLEDEFWEQLSIISKERNLSIPKLIEQIDNDRAEDQNLSSAIRVYILNSTIKN